MKKLWKNGVKCICTAILLSPKKKCNMWGESDAIHHHLAWILHSHHWLPISAICQWRKRGAQTRPPLQLGLKCICGKCSCLSASWSALPYCWLTRRLASFCWSTTVRAAVACCCSTADSVTSRHVVSWPPAEPATRKRSLPHFLLAKAHTFKKRSVCNLFVLLLYSTRTIKTI